MKPPATGRAKLNASGNWIAERAAKCAARASGSIQPRVKPAGIAMENRATGAPDASETGSKRAARATVSTVVVMAGSKSRANPNSKRPPARSRSRATSTWACSRPPSFRPNQRPRGGKIRRCARPSRPPVSLESASERQTGPCGAGAGLACPEGAGRGRGYLGKARHSAELARVSVLQAASPRERPGFSGEPRRARRFQRDISGLPERHARAMRRGTKRDSRFSKGFSAAYMGTQGDRA